MSNTNVPESSLPVGSDEGLKVTLPGDAVPAERWLWRGLLLVLCLLAYANSMTSNKFIWDDNRHAGAYSLHQNLDGLTAIWTRLGLEDGGTPQYYPLTHTMYWLEYQAFGEKPVGYRVVNVMVHAGCAVLLWELLRRIRVPGAYLAAVIFAVHPLMVESVAWTSERKNTLSLLLSLSALLAYARFAGVGEFEGEERSRDLSGEGPDWNMYVLAGLAFLGAMLSKTTAGYVPVLLLVGLWWKRKLTSRHFGLLVPWLVVALGLGLLTGFVEYRHVIRPSAGGSADTFVGWLSDKLTGQLQTTSEFRIPWSQRLMLSGMVPVFYVYKFFVPVVLTFFYPRWDLANGPAWWWGGLGLVVASVGWAAFSAKRGVRWPAVLVVGYLTALFPAMGFFDVYPFRYSFVADHFAYPATWLLVVAVGSGIAIFAGKRGWDRNPGLALGLGALLAVGLMARTYVHAGNFVDNTALFEQVLAHNGTSWAAMDNLAAEKIQNGQEAANLSKRYAAAGEAEYAKQATEESAADYERAESLLARSLELNPTNDRAMLQRGLLYVLEGKDDAALAEFRRSAATAEGNPDVRDGVNPTVYQQIGILLARKGEKNAAIASFRRAIELEHPPFYPKVGRTRLELLKLLVEDLRAKKLATTRGSSAAVATTRATTRPPLAELLTDAQAVEITNLSADVIELMSNNEQGWLLAGDLMRDAGRRNEAIVAYRHALQLAPNDVDAILSLGLALGDVNDLVGAEAAFEGALKIDPKRGDAKRALDYTLKLIEQAKATTRAAAASRAASRPAPK